MEREKLCHLGVKIPLSQKEMIKRMAKENVCPETTIIRLILKNFFDNMDANKCGITFQLPQINEA